MIEMPEVEPLSEARWGRIEQSLMQRLGQVPVEHAPEPRAAGAARHAKRRVGPRALAGVCAAVALAAAIALHAMWPSVHESTSRFATEASASHLTIAEASIDMSPESGIVVREEEHATVLVLERGEVALHVAPRPKDRPFLVEAGEVHVRVVGTEFSVRRAGVSAVVTVRRGIVEVQAHGEVARLKAGEGWPDGPLAIPPLTAMAPVALPASAPPGSALPSSALPAAAPVSAPVAATEPPPATLAPHSAASAPRATRRHSVAAAAPPLAAPPAPVATPPAAAAAPPTPALPPVSLDTAPIPPPEATPQSQYEAAEQIERTDPKRALRIYTALAAGSDRWAQNALFAAGRLQADRGAHADAARLLEEYLRRFPRGSNAQDARALREALH